MARVALVTGGNQGIGLEIVRQLCKQFDGRVLLACRSIHRGEEAKKKLESEGLFTSLLELDVNSKDSIRAARDTVEADHGRLDVLINNAGVLIRTNSGKSFSEKAFETIRTNYHGVLNVTTIFAPLLQPNSRIVNISSGLGNIKYLGPKRQKEILAVTTIDQLTSLMDEFVSDSQSSDYAAKGWIDPNGEYSTYSVSKIGVSRLTELLVGTLGKDPSKAGILINSVCPGWVRTSMGTMAAIRSVEEGADTPVYLSLLPPGTTEPNGLFLRDRVPASWK